MKLSKIKVEDLRADHEAFVEKMSKQPKVDGDHRGVPLAGTLTSDAALARDGQIVTVDTVGEGYYQNNPIAHNAVDAGVSKDYLITHLLGEVERLREELCKVHQRCALPIIVWEEGTIIANKSYRSDQ